MSADVLEELQALRRHRANGRVPKHGLWFQEDVDDVADRHEPSFMRSVCSFCGCRDVGEYSLVQDHCHDTGLFRGLLCRSCNVIEANRNTAAWKAWRLTAPGLEVGQRWIYQWSYGRMVVTKEELLALPMVELIQRLHHDNPDRLNYRYGLSPSEVAA